MPQVSANTSQKPGVPGEPCRPLSQSTVSPPSKYPITSIILSFNSVLLPLSQLPGTNFTRAVSSQSQTSSASAHYSIPPHSASTQQQRQPQAPPLSVAMTTTSALTSEGQWSSVQSMKQPLPPVPPYVKGYSGMWGGQPTPYGMQRPMDSGGGGARPGLPIDMGREERKRQLLRMQQEQMIQAQQARRMQQQQQQMVGHTPMYPPPPGQPPPGMMPMGQGGMPPGYSQGSSLPTHTMPPGHMNM